MVDNGTVRPNGGVTTICLHSRHLITNLRACYRSQMRRDHRHGFITRLSDFVTLLCDFVENAKNSHKLGEHYKWASDFLVSRLLVVCYLSRYPYKIYLVYSCFEKGPTHVMGNDGSWLLD